MTELAIGNFRLLRGGGAALVGGSAAFGLHVTLRSLATVTSDPIAAVKAPSWVPINLLGLAGAMLVLVGFPALFRQMVDARSRVGVIGLVLLSISWIFFALFLTLYSLLILPWLAERAPSLVVAGAPPPRAFLVAFAVGLLAWIAGTVLVAIPFLWHRASPTWVGYVVPASSVAMVVGNLVIAPSGPVANRALNLLSNLGPILLLGALGYLGFRLWVAPTRGRPG